MRAPLTPLKAFLHDAAALGRADSPGSSDDPRLSQWLTVAQAAERLASLPAGHREEYAARLSTSVLQSRDGRPTQTEGDGRAPTDALGQLAERIRLDAEDMEKAGCFEMARTTVSFVCQMLARAPLTSRLLATAHLGRVNRQIGDLPAAVDCYTTVTEQAQAVSDGPVAAHGFIGLGNVAHSRGNRPQQQAFFERALELSFKGGTQELLARQGLMIVANAQNRLVDALLHGWRAHDLAPPDSEHQLGIVGNLAHTAHNAGFFVASLAGNRHLLQRSTLLFNRLPAIGTAIRSAACQGDRDEVVRLQKMCDEEAPRSTTPFDSARAYLWCAEAWRQLGDHSRVTDLIEEAMRISDMHGFHELQHKAETLMAAEIQQRSDLAAQARALQTLRRSNSVVSEGIGRLESLALATA